MFNLKDIFIKRKNISVVKMFLDNPDEFKITMEVVGNKIIISAERKEEK